MARFKKVRGKGRRDSELAETREQLREALARIEQQESEIRALRGGDPDEKPRTSDSIPVAKKRPRPYTERDVSKLAYDYYEFLGGGVLDLKIRNEESKCRAFASQMRVAEGRDYFGEGAWGPTVSLYEERMSGALLGRLIKQKVDLLAQCEAKMRKALEEEYAATDEDREGPPPTVDFEAIQRGEVEPPLYMSREDTTPRPRPTPPAGAVPPIRTHFTEQEKQEFLDYLADPTPEPSKVVMDVAEAVEACRYDPRRLTPELAELLQRAGKIQNNMYNVPPDNNAR